MEEQPEALELADMLDLVHPLAIPFAGKAAAELRRLAHNNEVLMNALMKSCGDDEQMVNEYIESQGELK